MDLVFSQSLLQAWGSQDSSLVAHLPGATVNEGCRRRAKDLLVGKVVPHTVGCEQDDVSVSEGMHRKGGIVRGIDQRVSAELPSPLQDVLRDIGQLKWAVEALRAVSFPRGVTECNPEERTWV